MITNCLWATLPMCTMVPSHSPCPKQNPSFLPAPSPALPQAHSCVLVNALKLKSQQSSLLPLHHSPHSVRFRVLSILVQVSLITSLFLVATIPAMALCDLGHCNSLIGLLTSGLVFSNHHPQDARAVSLKHKLDHPSLFYNL